MGAAAPPPEPEVWKPFFAGQRIWAYVDCHSVIPGEHFDLMLSGGPGQPRRMVRVEFFRIGAETERLVWRSGPVPVEHHPVSRTAASVGANWPPALMGVDTAGWPPGCYSADVVEEGTGVRDVRAVQFVVRNAHRSGAMLVRLGTTTYQAYNAWGGHSLYPSWDEEARGALVSFDRPTPPTFFEYDVFLVRWLEGLSARTGLGVDYATNFDVHADPAILRPYPLVISASHDEYWSREEFDAFEQRIFRQGRNTVFFGANAAYFQVRYADLNRPADRPNLGRQLLCYKSLTDPIVRRRSAVDPSLLATARFRDGSRRPESMLLGAAYQSWFEPTSAQRPAYVVATTDSPFFHGTDWRVGDVAAEVVGYEWDNRDPDRDGARLFDQALSHIAELPAGAPKVLLTGTAVDATGRPGVAETVYFETPAGAKVLDAGSIRWSWGLGKEGYVKPAFQRFNENIVRQLARR